MTDFIVISVIVCSIYILYKIQQYKSCPKEIRKEFKDELVYYVNKDLIRQGYQIWEFSNSIIHKDDTNFDNPENLPIYCSVYEVKTTRPMANIVTTIFKIKSELFEPYGMPLIKSNNQRIFGKEYIDFIHKEHKYIARLYFKRREQYLEEMCKAFEEGNKKGKDFKGFFND